MSLQERAVRFALDAHERQVDKAGLPYFLHVLRVANRFRATPEVYAAAVLHDVVEDTFGKERQVDELQLTALFSFSIAQTVGALTRREPGMVYFGPEAETQGIRSRCCSVLHTHAGARERYLEEYIPRLRLHSIARYIKIADLEDNMDPSRCTDWNTYVGYESLRDKYRVALRMLNFQ